MIGRVAAALAGLMALIGPASADAWQTYANERFGATADVPADWRAGEPPANGDGLAFTSADGAARITVSGSLQTFDTIAEAMASYEAPNDGETVTYRHRGKRSVVVSGTSGDRIFYRKSILSCADTIWNSVSIDYPAADKSAYDALVTHVAGSLRAGPGWQAADCG